MARRLEKLDDSRLAARVHTGDEAAFEVLYDRHHRALLSFCRHMLGNAEDGEDALQQTFLRAHRALRRGLLPETVRPWLFAIARNRCRTMLAARRDACIPVEECEPSFDGLADGVALRADLRELLGDLARLPGEQREALVLFELGGLSQAEIGTTIGVPATKVKALVFQARSELMAERDARATPCASIREELSVARGGALRRGPLRRHLRNCEPCQAYRTAVATQRAGLASILPVAPALGLKAAVLAVAAGEGMLKGIVGGAAAGGVGAGGSAAGGAGAGAGVVAALIGGGAAGGMALQARSEPAGVNSAAIVATPTATPSPSPTPERKRGRTPRRERHRSPERTATPEPTAAAAPQRTPAPTTTAAAATPVATPTATVASATRPAAPPKNPKRAARETPRPAPVTGTVEEEPPPPVTGEFSEPEPTATATPAATAAPGRPLHPRRQRQRSPAAAPTPQP